MVHAIWQQRRLNLTATLNSLSPQTPLPHQLLMASLLQKAKALVGATPTVDPVPMHGGRASRAQPQSAAEKLARDHGQDRNAFGFGGFARRHRGLVLGAGLAAVGSEVHANYRGLLCGGPLR